jgi:hypothetical protein
MQLKMCLNFQDDIFPNFWPTNDQKINQLHLLVVMIFENTELHHYTKKEAKFVSNEVTFDWPGSNNTVRPSELDPTPIFSSGSNISKNIFEPPSADTLLIGFFMAANISFVLICIIFCVQSI